VEFVFTGNTDQLKEKFKDTEKGLLGLTDIAEKAGETLDNMIDGDILKNLKSMGIEVGKTGAELKKALKDADNFVSGMEDGLKIVVAEHAKLLAEINKMPEGNARNQLLEEYRNEAVEIEKVSNQITQYKEFLSNVKDESKSLSVKLKEVTDEMKVLYDRGEQNSDRYQELAEKASEYQKANEAVNKSLKALKDNAGLTALVETMGLASGAFSTYQGIVALVGSKNEDLEKIMIRLQSAIAVTVGIQQIQNSLSKESSLLQSIQAVQTLARAKADELAAVATGKATIAQRVFNLVAKANPYVLLAAAILSVVGAVYLFTRRTDEASNIQKKMNDALKESASNTAKELVELERLYRTATNDKLSREQRLKAVNALKDAYPGLFQNINDEIILNGKAAASYLAVKDAILEKAKANAAQTVLEEAYTEQLKNQQGYNEELNILYGRTAEIKKRIKKDGEFSEVDGILGNKVRVNNNDQLRQTRERIGAINKEVGRQNKQVKNQYDVLVNTIIKGNAAIDKATTAPAPNKGTGEWYKQEIATLEELRQKAVVGSKEWDILGKKIENYQNLLNPKANNGTKPTKSPKSVAEEFLPEGSVAEIQRRLSKIDEALSKATNEEQISQLKAKRISTAKELAEAEKLIQIKTLQEQFDESEKLWQQYYSAVASLDKETADKIFGDALKNDKASFEALEKQRKDLLAKGNLTDEEKNYFTFIDEKLNSMLGKKNQLDQFKQTIEETLSTLGTDAEKLNFINEKKTTANKTTGEYATLTEFENKILEEQKQRYQEFLAAQKTFEEKRLEIAKKYAEQRQKIYEDTNLSENQKQNALISSDKLESSEISDAFANSLLNDPAFTQNFEKIGEFAFAQFDKIKAALLKKLEEARNAGLDENSDVVQRIIEQLKRLDEAASRNPFSELINDWKKFIDALNDGESDLQGIASKVAAGASMVNKSISVGLGIAQDLGLQFDESTQEVINDVQTTVAGVGDLAAGIASKNPMQIIKGIAGIVKGLAGLFNGDRKKEKQIQEWANQVKNLKVQYQELERAIDKALGSDKYTAQQNVIANLEKQKILLQQMIQKEKEKKKTDNGKIDDWNQQISDINAQIDDLKKSIVDDILQIDVKGLADKIGDALIDGFGRGEDALVSLNKTADEVFRQMVKNALKLELEKRMQPIINEMLKAMGYSNNDDALKAQIEALEKQKEALSGNAWSTMANANQIASINKLISDLKAKLGQTTGSFDGLTPEEREALKAQIIAATGDYQKAMEQYADLFGPDAANSPNGLKGDIKGMTEKTAGALESQINAIRIYQVEALNVSKRNQQIFIDSLKYQAEIAYNTRELKLIRQGIDDLNIKVKKL